MPTDFANIPVTKIIIMILGMLFFSSFSIMHLVDHYLIDLDTDLAWVVLVFTCILHFAKHNSKWYLKKYFSKWHLAYSQEIVFAIFGINIIFALVSGIVHIFSFIEILSHDQENKKGYHIFTLILNIVFLIYHLIELCNTAKERAPRPATSNQSNQNQQPTSETMPGAIPIPEWKPQNNQNPQNHQNNQLPSQNQPRNQYYQPIPTTESPIGIDSNQLGLPAQNYPNQQNNQNNQYQPPVLYNQPIPTSERIIRIAPNQLGLPTQNYHNQQYQPPTSNQHP